MDENKYNYFNDVFLKSISPKSIFLYGVILCFFIFFFRHSHISFSVTIGIICALIVIFFLYKNEKNSFANKESLHQTKLDFITPESKKLANYTDLTDFIFSIQDFHEYNQQSYIELINALDIFLEAYEDVMIDNSLGGDLYSIADAQKLIALNSLQSIIIMIPSSKLLIDKLNDSLKIFEKLLNKYLLEIYEKNKKYIKENGYFNNTKVIDLKIDPYNKYSVNEDMENEYYFKYY